MDMPQATLVGYNSDMIVKAQDWQFTRLAGILYNIEQCNFKDHSFEDWILTFQSLLFMGYMWKLKQLKTKVGLRTSGYLCVLIKTNINKVISATLYRQLPVHRYATYKTGWLQ